MIETGSFHPDIPIKPVEKEFGGHWVQENH